MKLYDKRPRFVPCTKPDDKAHLFAVADLMAYMCGTSCRYGAAVSVASGKDRHCFISLLMLEAFLDGGTLNLAEDEDALTGTERFLFSRLLMMLTCGNNENELIDFARCYLDSLEPSGQLTLPLLVGAEAIVAMKTAELSYSVNPYTYMAYCLGGIMGHPFTEEYIKDFKNGAFSGSDDYCKRVNALFPETELLRKERLAQLEKERRRKTVNWISDAQAYPGGEACESYNTIEPFSVQDEKTGGTVCFTDLEKLSDAEMELLMKKLGSKDIAMALSPKNVLCVRAKAFLNTPSTVAEKYQLQLCRWATYPMYAGEVRSAQKTMLEAALELIHSDKVLPQKAGDAFIRCYNADEETVGDEKLPCDIGEVSVMAGGKIGKLCFTDLAGIDDRDMRKILREVPAYGLALALVPKSAVNVRQKVFNNMSKRAAAMLLEDIYTFKKVKTADVMDSQQRMLSVACRLRDSGEILFPGETWDDGDAPDWLKGLNDFIAEFEALPEEEKQKVLGKSDKAKKR